MRHFGKHQSCPPPAFTFPDLREFTTAFFSGFFILFQLLFLFSGGTMSVHTVKPYREFKTAALNRYPGFHSFATSVLLHGITCCYVALPAPSSSLKASFNIMPKKPPYLDFCGYFGFSACQSCLLPAPPSLGDHTGNQSSFLQEWDEDSVAPALLSSALGIGDQDGGLALITSV